MYALFDDSIQGVVWFDGVACMLDDLPRERAVTPPLLLLLLLAGGSHLG